MDRVVQDAGLAVGGAVGSAGCAESPVETAVCVCPSHFLFSFPLSQFCLGSLLSIKHMHQNLHHRLSCEEIQSKTM